MSEILPTGQGPPTSAAPSAAGHLQGRVAFVTGAARGQGRAHAVRMALEGADVIACDVCGPVATTKYAAATPADLQETASLVTAQGRRCIVDQVDVRELNALEAFVAHSVGQFGRLDVVIVNAGILSAGFLWELSEEQWQTMIDVNLTGAWKTLKVTVPYLIAGGRGGSIILTSSVAGLRGTPFTGHYAAAKHGVVGLCRTLANELGRYDIRVNTVHPAGVDTLMVTDPDLLAMIASHRDTLAPIFMNSLPHQSMSPDDVAAAVAWLASDEARYVTGAQLPVDFGTLSR
jgi:SDR family mycofactocin-dependent oxidoreductase